MRKLSVKAAAAAFIAVLALTSAGRAAETHAVQERTVPDYKMVAATLTTRDMGEARARIAGTLTELRVREGDTVTKGQTLAVIADQKNALEVQARQAQAGALKAERDRAEADLARVKTVFDKGFYSKARLDQAVAAAKSAESAWKAAVASQAVVSEQVGQGKVLAPAAGRVVRASVPAGAVVMAGDVIAVVATNDAVVRIEVPEREARGLKKGDAVRLVGEGGAVDGRDVAARVREIYPEIRNGRVTADLEAAGLGSGFVGERVRVLIAAGERRAIVVPQDFVTTRFGVDYVSLAGKGGALDIPVQRGQHIDVEGVPDGIEILSGLKPGDTIIRPDGKLVTL
ncbi:MAG: efflux RND transporter periplasmic adaptor subunit [Alphaproteobacteria bacterium]|nr:efflux RND transporter periplasmic adaptor subunit [Alphaproteobacteria bacterium]